jgi:hypothetical protein
VFEGKLERVSNSHALAAHATIPAPRVMSATQALVFAALQASIASESQLCRDGQRFLASP